jgi:hypothetical protein
VFAADAVSLWRLNQNLPVINCLAKNPHPSPKGEWFMDPLSGTLDLNLTTIPVVSLKLVKRHPQMRLFGAGEIGFT